MALIKISIIASDTRWAKEIRFLGIPVFLIRELNVKTQNDEPARRIGFPVYKEETNSE